MKRDYKGKRRGEREGTTAIKNKREVERCGRRKKEKKGGREGLGKRERIHLVRYSTSCQSLRGNAASTRANSQAEKTGRNSRGCLSHLTSPEKLEGGWRKRMKEKAKKTNKKTGNERCHSFCSQGGLERVRMRAVRDKNGLSDWLTHKLSTLVMGYASLV